MAKEKIGSIDELKYDEHNFNKHTDEGLKLLEKSVEQNKFGRSILVDKDNNIIAGNGIVETARKLGKTKIRVVETSGEELVVVKRNDLHIDSKEGRELALADNATSAANLQWNEEELAFAKENWGVQPDDWGVYVCEAEDNEEGNIYTAKIELPSYEPNGIIPAIEEMIDTSKRDELVREIENAKLDDSVKTFLKEAANRHTVFNYEKIADFYANASKEVQELMEDSALVIIDFNKAIEKGFVKVTKDLEEMYKIDNDCYEE